MHTYLIRAVTRDASFVIRHAPIVYDSMRGQAHTTTLAHHGYLF